MSDVVSICIPSRNEQHLQKTVRSLLTHAHGEVEVIAVLDGGPWPDPPLPPEVVVVRHNEPHGMRQSINEAAEVASGKYFMKCDGHCIFSDGYDEALKAGCEEDWLVVPTRHSINAERWESNPDDHKAIRPRNFNYTALTFPFSPTEYGIGFHAVTFPWDENKAINREFEDTPIDDIIGAQGSCWFQHLDNFKRLGPLDYEAFYFYQESQEVTFRQWLTGGRAVVNKNAWYGHYHKGKDNQGADGRKGRGYYLDLRKKRGSEATMVERCLTNGFVGQTRTFDSLIEQFWPFLSRLKGNRTWPEDWKDWEKHRRAFEHRDDVPAHIPA